MKRMTENGSDFSSVKSARPTADQFPASSHVDARSALNPMLNLGAINDSLRQQLASSNQNNISENIRQDESATADISVIASEAIKAMLEYDVVDRQFLQQKLGNLFEGHTKVYYKAPIPDALRKRQFISQHGLVLSPNNCITSILDVLRVRAFVRGINNALKKLSTEKKTGPVHIVYPACGPYAPLLLPLINYYAQHNIYSAADVRITLIDMQPGAVMSLKALIQEYAIEDYIDDVLCQDAVAYQAMRPVHLVIIEAMQHGFSREAHLMLARHFAGLLEPGGMLLPQSVSVRAVLNIGQREYVDQWKTAEYCEHAQMNPEIQTERTDLGEILAVTASSLRDMVIETLDEQTSLIECNTVTVPPDLQQADKQLLLLCSRVKVFGNEEIEEYDSGITHPLPDEQLCIDFSPSDSRPGDLLINKGDSLKFYYRINGLPGFFAVKQ